MTEQQQFQPGDRVKVTIDLTVGDMCDWPPNGPSSLSDLWGLSRYPDQDHVTVELIERAKPPRETGWYPCRLDGGRIIYLLHWDGESWHWHEEDDGKPQVTGKITVVGDRISLNEGVEL